MEIDSVLSDIRSLEHQLAVLKAEIKLPLQGERPKTFADLNGIWAGQSETTEGDLDSVEYRFGWEGQEFGGASE